ncbi:MAG: hypothetical protein PHC41_08375 [Lachnospiraceae bacterium]|nr:hypothetical protein [Lachnospiraceae bacterium]MDD3616223.1 hypothetical protein [Lachnospiraceae bacterium]
MAYQSKGRFNAKEKSTYIIMHGEKKVASVNTSGKCEIYEKNYMPYNLYMEAEAQEFDELFNNLSNFYFWCASRMLTLDRTYAKEILNSIGVSQAVTDKERAHIALSYHCVVLTDIYWVKEFDEPVTFAEINLYENHLDNAFVDVSLRGRQVTIENSTLIADDLSTGGMFPKAWIRESDGFYLLKDGGMDAVHREVLASKVSQCFKCNQVYYEESNYKGEPVSKSKIITSVKYSLVSREAFDIYAKNQDIDVMEFIKKLDSINYYTMNIIDYLIGNTDRHWGNWGFLVDNQTNQPVRLYNLMDFNRAFSAYDTIDGANCLTVSGTGKKTQLEAAVEAVCQIGFHPIAEAKEEWFAGKKSWYEMFQKRWEILEQCKR